MTIILYRSEGGKLGNELVEADSGFSLRSRIEWFVRFKRMAMVAIVRNGRVIYRSN